MTPVDADLARWLVAPREDEHLEFKEAKSSFDFDKAVKYCAALANERGGHLVLGVSDKPPRQVVGTKAFVNVDKVKSDLMLRVPLRIEATELTSNGGRVLVFSVPPRPIGTAIAVEGAYWMRRGESLVPMTPDLLKRIFDEGVPDFTASVCPGATTSDLSPELIEQFQRRWEIKQPSPRVRALDTLLEDAELLVDGGLTYAALVLLGTRRALGRYLPNAEIIFEYRSDAAAIQSEQRVELRDGFLAIHDELWKLVNLRNTVHSYVDGLFRREIATFNEGAVREAMLNAVCHRDYRHQGSIFIKQWPTSLQLSSPGGFPPGITVENILFKQHPRNRRLAEAFSKCGLVERAGQGADLMFEAALREGKTPLDFGGTDETEVRLTLDGRVKDGGFLRFLEKATADVGRALRTDELVVLDAVRREGKWGDKKADAITGLLDLGLVERAGKGRLLIARKYDRILGRAGERTRKRGLDRATNKHLLTQHLLAHPGSPLGELCEVLPHLSASQVRVLLKELREAGQVWVEGRTRAGRWFSGGPK